ncbi:DUF1883 domain-containing protein [Mesorhizobium sp. M1076]|uniref:DUF1883 domain-containing protein n=1 Tax=Mesorhizobium sp. M1076 TaxID=2957054 RepID=UPI003335EDAE
MSFTHCDLWQCSRGQMAEITLTSGANLRLLDLTSCSIYGRGERHQYIGRLAKQPVRLQVPKSVHWHVAVDMQGLKGIICSSIRKLPGPLPELRESLCSVPCLVRDSTPPGTSTDGVQKGWTNYELDGIAARSVKREQKLLPTWHKSPKALLQTRLTISYLITSVIAA